jgi:predicted RNA-binding protein YlqC (UPF0109 family)
MNIELCRGIRVLLAPFVSNSESLDVSCLEENGKKVFILHILSKDKENISGQDDKIISSLKNLLQCSLSDNSVDIKIDILG